MACERKVHLRISNNTTILAFLTTGIILPASLSVRICPFQSTLVLLACVGWTRAGFDSPAGKYFLFLIFFLNQNAFMTKIKQHCCCVARNEFYVNNAVTNEGVGIQGFVAACNVGSNSRVVCGRDCTESL